MTTPSDPDNDTPDEPVNLGKEQGAGTSDPAAEQPFDPYRFGKPDHPIPAEYAPPGYTGPVLPPAHPYSPPDPWTRPPATGSDNPFSNPPGTPYAPPNDPTAAGSNAQGRYAPGPNPQDPYAQRPSGSYGAPPQQGYGPPPPHQGYGPSPYQGYGPPPYHGYAQPRTGNGKAVAALILGILSVVFCFLSFFDAVFVIPGLVFSLIAMSEAKQPGRGGRGMAIAGLICTIVGALLASVFTALIVHAANKCGGLSNSSDSSFQQCVRDNIW